MKKSFKLSHFVPPKQLAHLRERAQTKKPRPPLLSLPFPDTDGFTAEICASSKVAGEVIAGLFDKDGDCVGDPIHSKDVLGVFNFEFDKISFEVEITDTKLSQGKARSRAPAPPSSPSASEVLPPAPEVAPPLAPSSPPPPSRPIDPSAVTKYLLRGGAHCPFCRNARLVRTYPSQPKFVDGALDLATQCTGCQRRWTDRLRIAAVIAE